MVLEEKMPDLLMLLTSYARRYAPMVPIVSWPPTLAPSIFQLLMPSRKREKEGNLLRILKKGQYPSPYNSHLPRSLKSQEFNKERHFYQYWQGHRKRATV